MNTFNTKLYATYGIFIIILLENLRNPIIYKPGLIIDIDIYLFNNQ